MVIIMLSCGKKTTDIYVKIVQFIETLYKGDIVVRYIKQQIDEFFTIIKFPTSPLKAYIVSRVLLTMYNGEVGNFIMVKK